MALGARAMLNMTQAALAERAKLSTTALNNIERGSSDPKTSTLRAIQDALEAAGVEFLNHGQPGVRLHARIAAANALDQQRPESGSPLDTQAEAEFHRREDKREHE